jgi:hypothetical protein
VSSSRRLRTWRSRTSLYRLLRKEALALLDHLKIDHAVVGGISLGSAIALRLAAQDPNRVRGLQKLEFTQRFLLSLYLHYVSRSKRKLNHQLTLAKNPHCMYQSDQSQRPTVER